MGRDINISMYLPEPMIAFHLVFCLLPRLRASHIHWEAKIAV